MQRWIENRMVIGSEKRGKLRVIGGDDYAGVAGTLAWEDADCRADLSQPPT
jgi:hypothetical protein